MHSWYYEIRVCEWGGVEWEKILALWSIFIMLVWHVLMLFCAIFAFFFKPLLQPFNFDKKYKRTKIHVERSVVDNVVVSHYVPKLNERLVQYSSTIVPIFIVSALVDASFSYKDTWNYLYFMGQDSEAVQITYQIFDGLFLLSNSSDREFSIQNYHPHDRRSMTHTTPKPWLIHQTFGMYPTT